MANFAVKSLALSFVFTMSYSTIAEANDANKPGMSPTRPKFGASVETDQGFMVPYEEKIPGTEIVFRMIPIPGGVVTLGSPAEETNRNIDEGPQTKVRIQPMWVARCEVTWAQYHAYMAMYEPFKQLDQLRYQLSKKDAQADAIKERLAPLQAITDYLRAAADVDAVTCPTPVYDPSFTYEPGEDPQQPAVTMTQFAARQFTKWLSGITQREYRLPSEAEWEYFARAGTSTAYSFGEGSLNDFAWYTGNSKDATHPVGTKKANPWGLHDVHGNVSEWVLDQYDAKAYLAFRSKSVASFERVIWPTQLEPRVLRGGSWLDDPPLLRSAARLQSADEDWAMSDPNLPVSPWWFTEYEATGVGMRVMRPHRPMDVATKQHVWEANVKDLQLDVEDRLTEGRGTIGSASPELPEAANQIKVINVQP